MAETKIFPLAVLLTVAPRFLSLLWSSVPFRL